MISMCSLKKVRYLPGFLVLLTIISCTKQSEYILIGGNTMGTTYSVKIRNIIEKQGEINTIQSKIDSTLKDLNQQVSTYIPDSDITKFNESNSLDWIEIPLHFQKVIEKALEVYTISNGAFDVTVHPVVRLWGFGKDGRKWVPPEENQVKIARESIGSQYLHQSGSRIKKDLPGLEIDLSAIAKGYGVDLVFDLLGNLGYHEFMVEIGGEVRCTETVNTPYWKIGIERPNADFRNSNKLAEIVKLRGMAMATSGNYRNYFIYDGKRFSHTINPLTGKPVEHSLMCTTIIASTCIYADALATAVMVMGSNEGMKLIESLENVECFLLEEEGDGSITTFSSKGFKEFID